MHATAPSCRLSTARAKWMQLHANGHAHVILAAAVDVSARCHAPHHCAGCLSGMGCRWSATTYRWSSSKAPQVSLAYVRARQCTAHGWFGCVVLLKLCSCPAAMTVVGHPPKVGAARHSSAHTHCAWFVFVGPTPWRGAMRLRLRLCDSNASGPRAAPSGGQGFS